jgi:cyclophilin family peptidyl-prolyl cis-trans isomerase
MTATPIKPLEGTESPNQIEFLWERYRRHVNAVLTLVLLAFAGYYTLKWVRQRQVDQHWSAFCVTLGIDKSYLNTEGLPTSLAENLDSLDLPKLEQYLGSADSAQAPYVHLAIARRAMQAKNWDRAEAALKELESRFPNHELVVAGAYPVQVREEVKKEAQDEPRTPGKKPEYKPAKAGSPVGLMREQLLAAKSFAAPAQFAKPEIPADAPKVKFEFSDGSAITVALMAKQAPKLCEQFLALAKQDPAFWVGLNIDEVQRNGKGFAKHPKQFHLGFTTTREEERSKWTKTDASKHEVEFEAVDLSHFAGAVSAREATDGKSAADRFWVCAEDASEFDGQRTVFAYVVEGLEAAAKICDASMSAQEDEAGSGVPSDKITVTKVTVL